MSDPKPPVESRMIAFLDESVPESPRGIHYVLASAVLLDDRGLERARRIVRKAVGDRARPFRWSKEGVMKRDAMTAALGEIGCGVVAAVHYPVGPRRQIAARRGVLTAVAAALGLEGVESLVIESRGPQDSDDRQTLIEAMHSGVAPANLTYRFADKSEVLLWLADAAAGILADAEIGRDRGRLVELQQHAAILEVRRLER